MSERIEVGDLVMIVRPSLCCGDSRAVGQINLVKSQPLFVHTRCAWCGLRYLKGKFGQEWLLDDNYCVEETRLRKIPPLSELESTEHKEEVPA